MSSSQLKSNIFDSRKKAHVNSCGCTVWFTGLPSSGKSTLAQLLHQELEELGISAEGIVNLSQIWLIGRVERTA